jgi:hypothetical protein
MLYLSEKKGNYMSFKVYGGLKLEGITTLEDSFKFIETVRGLTEVWVEKRVAHDIKVLACLIHDMYHCVGINILEGDESVSNDESPLLAATTKIFEGNRSAPSHETEYVLSLGFHKDAVVAIPFFPEDSAIPELLELPNVNEFGYWDNVDPLEGVPYDEWELRGKIWNEVLHGSGIPAETMLTVRLADSKYLVPRDEFMADITSVENRTKSLVMNIAYDRAYKLLEKVDNIPADQFSRYLQKTAANAIEDIKKEIDGKLNEKLTMKDLEKPLTGEANDA